MSSSQLDDIIDFRQIFFKILKNWFLLLVSLILAFCIAFSYNRYSSELFGVEASIIVKEDDGLSNASDLLYDHVRSSNKIIENKELELKSFPLIYETLKDLKFNIAYFIEGNIKVTETYDSPVIVKCVDTRGIQGKTIRINIVDDNSFILSHADSEVDEVRKFNEKFLFHDTEISVEYNINFLPL